MALVDGKAPLLLASLLFAVGSAGLLLTSAERADWGPFQPHEPPPKTVAYVGGRELLEPPPLHELRAAPELPLVAAEPELLVTAPAPVEDPPPVDEPTPTPVPPLRVFGISSDSGVSAAAATQTPPPVVIGGVAADDGEATETPEADATESPAEPE
jgi:hypothetical protein